MTAKRKKKAKLSTIQKRVMERAKRPIIMVVGSSRYDGGDVMPTIVGAIRAARDDDSPEPAVMILGRPWTYVERAARDACVQEGISYRGAFV